MRSPACVVTQGFIASDAAGDTVLLGRGGSDTSAAYFAAKLLARSGSRSGPTCRDCSVPIRVRRRRRGCCAHCITTKRRRSPPAAPRCCTRAASCRPSRNASRLRSTPRRARRSRARTSAPRAATAWRRSRRCASRRASRWCRSKVRACGTRSAFWPMRSRSSSVTACRSIWCPPPRPMSPYRWIRPPIRSIRS